MFFSTKWIRNLANLHIQSSQRVLWMFEVDAWLDYHPFNDQSTRKWVEATCPQHRRVLCWMALSMWHEDHKMFTWFLSLAICTTSLHILLATKGNNEGTYYSRNRESKKTKNTMEQWPIFKVYCYKVWRDYYRFFLKLCELKNKIHLIQRDKILYNM